MPETTKCETCAFRPGTRANRSGLTLMKARLCGELEQEFSCHHNTVFVTVDNRVITADTRNRFDVLTSGKPAGEYQEVGESRPCVGWLEMVATLRKQGYYEQQPDWQKQLKAKLLEIIAEAEASGEEWDDDTSAQRVRQAVEAVGLTQSPETNPPR